MEITEEMRAAQATAQAGRKQHVFPSSGIIKITDKYEDDGEEYWIQFRPLKERFKGGERKEIYRYLDELKDAGQIYLTLALIRRVALHVIHDWSFDLPVPRVEIKEGKVIGYTNENVLDELDTEAEDWVLAYAKQWVEKMAINFAIAKEPDSPTSPSAA